MVMEMANIFLGSPKDFRQVTRKDVFANIEHERGVRQGKQEPQTFSEAKSFAMGKTDFTSYLGVFFL